MRFSQRTDWNFELNQITRTLNDLRGRGCPVLDLTCSNPTRVQLPELDSGFLSVLSDRASLAYHPEACGHKAAREAVARYYHEQGIDIGPSDILLTAGTSEAYSFLFHILLDAGESQQSDRILFVAVGNGCGL